VPQPEVRSKPATTGSIRRFLAAIVLMIIAVLPSGATAQPPVARIAILGMEAQTEAGVALRQAFLDALRERGWEEGRNLEILQRWAEGRAERYPQLAAELVALRPDVIVVQSTQGTRAVRGQTDAIPIVMLDVADPIASGFIAGLRRPGGNVTGLSAQGSEMWGKFLQLLHDIRPGISRIAALWIPDNPASTQRRNALAAIAPQLAITLQSFTVTAAEELPAVLSDVARWHPDAFLLDPSPLVGVHRREVIAFALEQRLPTLAAFTQWAREGALMSFSPDAMEIRRRAADYVDRILRGAKPADLPVEQPTKFEFVLNLKTARAIGVEFPPLFFARADEVIE
jgi:putative ABC transport system substrate-binding protein